MENLPQIINQVLNVFSQKFGQDLSFLWSRFILQQRIEGLEFLIIGMVFLYIFGALLKNILEEARMKPEINVDVIMAIFLFGSFILALLSLFESFSRLFNPEYHAIQDILNLIFK